MSRVLVTRSANDSLRLADIIRTLGGTPVIVPLVERVHAPQDMQPPLHPADWVWFTSPASVEVFRKTGRSISAYGKRVLAIGPRTRQRLEQYGVTVAFVPVQHSIAGILAELPGVHESTVYYPRSALSPDEAITAIRNQAKQLIDVCVYSNHMPSDAGPHLFAEWPVDIVTLCSSSAATRLCTLISTHKLRKPSIVIALGTRTANTCAQHKMHATHVATPQTLSGLTECIASVLHEGGH